jgi:cytochrome b6-f complex iron-sulfur subunit
MGSSKKSPEDRRKFLINLFMGTGLVGSHLTFAAFGLRFLQPVQRARKQRLLVGLKSEMPPGAAIPFKTPEGKTINIINGPSGFVALSDVCPHLGCRVYWDGARNKFICPCHDGHFDAAGKPIAGPPADMGQPLLSYKVIEEGNLILLDLVVTS